MLRKADALRWTPHMDECLRQLSERCEWHGDMVLAVQVRCHLIVEQIAHSPWELGPSGENMMAPDAEPTNLPPAAYVKALQAELQDIQRSLPPEALQDGESGRPLHQPVALPAPLEPIAYSPVCKQPSSSSSTART